MKIKDNYLKFKLIYNLIFLTILFFVNCFWGEMVYISFGVFMLLVMLDNLENGFTYIMFSIPYCLIYPQNHISTILFFVGIIFYVIKLYFIYFFKEKGKINKFILISFAILLIYCLIPFSKYNYNVFFKISLIFFVLLALFMFSKKPDIFRLNFNARIFAVSLLISALFGLLYWVSPYIHSLIGELGLLGGTKFFRFQALFNQPNVLAMICEILLSILAYFIITNKGRWQDVVLFLLIAALGVMTFSKTYIIILFIVLLALFIWLLKVNWKKTLIITAIICLVVLMICVIKPTIPQLFYNRFLGTMSNCNNFEDFMNMVTTDRYNLWKETVVYLAHHPVQLIFGRGLGAPVLSIFSAHNAYLSMIYQLGIVGSIIFITTLVLTIKQPQKQKFSGAVAIPLIVLFLILCVEDMIFYIL